ncbi:MAG: protein TolR [Alphaproteobacteria bacterium]|jgi:biopolymer transport protein TolR|nr:protein TolR [Alphaproteobacteria bacterium]
MAVSINRASHKHGSRRRSTGQAFCDINVTPFVDVMLVLLVIFMVTAPMLTVGVPVDLPKTKAAKMNDQVEPLVVSVDANGKSYLQEAELEGDALIERLIAVSGSNPDTKIYVRGDQKINYGRVMEIMGVIAAAGFNKVSLIAEMPTGPDKGKNLKVKSPALATPAPQSGTPLGLTQRAPLTPSAPPPQAMMPSGNISQQAQQPPLMSQTRAAPPVAPQVPAVRIVRPTPIPANDPKVIRSP